jgi:hypothetical protein
MYDKYTQIHWYDQTNKTRWEIDVRDVKIGSESFWNSSRKGVIDTFFKTVTLPKAEFDKFKLWVIDNIKEATCDNVKGTC